MAMVLSLRTVRIALVASTLVGLMLTCGLQSAFGGTGAQRAFAAKLENTERSVAAARTKLDAPGSGIVGQSRAVGAKSASLAKSAGSLSDADVAELSASGIDASQRVSAVSAEIADLLADPRLAQLLDAESLAKVDASLIAARRSLQLVTVELNPSLVLWNTLGSASEIVSSPVGGAGTLTIPGASFVAGRFGGAVRVPADRDDQSQQLRFGDYVITPEGTIELWFKQDGYNTVNGQPDDGRFHSFWSPDVSPYDVRGASLLTYQVPGEGWHFDVWDGTNYVRNTVFPDIAAGQWHHVAFTWSSSGSYSEVYLDGVLLNRVEQTLDIAAPVYLPLQFGFDWDANNRGANSVLDDLKVWSEPKNDFSDRFTE
jgi:hypothetical protein